MRVIGHGIDLVLIARVERIWQRHGQRFLDRTYTAAEQAYCLDSRTPAIRLAGRFAAKEAVMKVLGTGWTNGVEFSFIETLPDKWGKPVVTLHGTTAEFARRQGVEAILMSISHAGEYAMASALGIGP